jgi:hypothetical protein
MTTTTYQHLSIEQLEAIVAKLAAAMQAPRCTNRAQVVEWWAAAWRAYDTAMGWR